jgi:hypothetical protein
MKVERFLVSALGNKLVDVCRFSIRNSSQPDNRNNNIGFRVASTLQRIPESAAPEPSDSLREFWRECAKCEVQIVALCSAGIARSGQTSDEPGRAGRLKSSNVNPGLLL